MSYTAVYTVSTAKVHSNLLTWSKKYIWEQIVIWMPWYCSCPWGWVIVMSLVICWVLCGQLIVTKLLTCLNCRDDTCAMGTSDVIWCNVKQPTDYEFVITSTSLAGHVTWWYVRWQEFCIALPPSVMWNVIVTDSELVRDLSDHFLQAIESRRSYWEGEVVSWHTCY